MFIYDLEDSVSPVPEDKVNARERLRAFLSVEYLFLFGFFRFGLWDGLLMLVRCRVIQL